jgi:hypothetical protein
MASEAPTINHSIAVVGRGATCLFMSRPSRKPEPPVQSAPVQVFGAWPLMMTREQVCAYLNISPEMFAKACPVPPIDWGGSGLRWNREHIDAWVASCPPRLTSVQRKADTAAVLPFSPDTPEEMASEERRADSLDRVRKRTAKKRRVLQ